MTNAWGYGDEESDAEGDTVAITLTPFQSELLARIDRIADALEPREVAGLAPLLDADPEAMGSAIDAATTALQEQLRIEGSPAAGYSRERLERLAETVIDAALKQATPTGP